jgi:hypothetical protein
VGYGSDLFNLDIHENEPRWFKDLVKNKLSVFSPYSSTLNGFSIWKLYTGIAESLMHLPFGRLEIEVYKLYS